MNPATSKIFQNSATGTSFPVAENGTFFDLHRHRQPGILQFAGPNPPAIVPNGRDAAPPASQASGATRRMVPGTVPAARPWSPVFPTPPGTRPAGQSLTARSSKHPAPGSPLPSPARSASAIRPQSSAIGRQAANPLDLAVSRLTDTYKPEAIWLFGSQARSEAGPDSDYDLLMIVPDDADRQHRKADLAYRALRSLGRAFDITIWRRSAFEEQTRSATSLPTTVLREGRLLYAA